MVDSATTQALGGFFSNPLSSVIGPAVGASLSAITPTVSADPIPEALHWTPPPVGEPVYPKGFRPKTIDILEQYPDSDSDMVRHYVRAEELGNQYGPLVSRAGIYSKEFVDLLGRPFGVSRAGFSIDDILAAETALQGKTPQEAYDAGVYKHTERGITGFGQGKWRDVKKKAQDLGLEVPFASEARGFFDRVTDPNRWVNPFNRGTTTQEQPFIPIRSPLDGFGSPIKDIPEGTFAPFQGQQIDWDLPAPKREDWFPTVLSDAEASGSLIDSNEADAFPVFEDSPLSNIEQGGVPIVERDPVISNPIGGDRLLGEPSTENLNTILMNTLVPMQGITETVETLPSGPEEMTEVVDIPEIVSSLPSGPEDMYIPFEQDQETIDIPQQPEGLTPVEEVYDDIGEDVPFWQQQETIAREAALKEQIRIDKIVAQAAKDRIRLEKQAEAARQQQLDNERQAREASERADRIEREARERDEEIKADDRKAIARARQLEAKKKKKAREAAAKKRQAVEAARLNALAAAAKKMADMHKKKQEAEARRAHELNMQMLERMRNQRLMDRLKSGSDPGQYLYDI